MNWKTEKGQKILLAFNEVKWHAKFVHKSSNQLYLCSTDDIMQISKDTDLSLEKFDDDQELECHKFDYETLKMSEDKVLLAMKDLRIVMSISYGDKNGAFHHLVFDKK